MRLKTNAKRMKISPGERNREVVVGGGGGNSFVFEMCQL